MHQNVSLNFIPLFPIYELQNYFESTCMMDPNKKGGLNMQSSSQEHTAIVGHF